MRRLSACRKRPTLPPSRRTEQDNGHDFFATRERSRQGAKQWRIEIAADITRNVLKNYSGSETSKIGDGIETLVDAKGMDVDGGLV